jgi:hypothetical protein
MTVTSSGGLPLSNAKPIDMSSVKLVTYADNPQAFDDFAARLQAQLDQLNKSQNYDAHAQFEKQASTPVRAKFYVNGELIGVLGNGLTGRNSMANVGFQEAETTATQMGLYGERRDKFIVDQISKNLEGRYGNRVETVYYAPDQRPQWRDVYPEMFGRELRWSPEMAQNAAETRENQAQQRDLLTNAVNNLLAMQRAYRAEHEQEG